MLAPNIRRNCGPALLRWGVYFTKIHIGSQPWQDLRRIRFATCPYLGCKLYTSVFRINFDGTIGEAVTGWPGTSFDGPEYLWWDDAPWCWMVTQFITSTSGSNQTMDRPAGWDSSDNIIEVIASGSGGSTGGCAGTGAAYSKEVDVVLSPGSITFFLDVGGAASTAGPDAWYNGASLGASSVGAKGGGQDNTFASQTGGAAGSGIGSTKYSGGDATVSAGNFWCSAGGGAAGPNGDGGASTENSASLGVGGGGGGGNGGGADGGATSTITGAAGGNNSGASGSGAGGGANTNGSAGTAGGGGGGGGGSASGTQPGHGGAGGAGTEFDASYGSGGGGGGGGNASSGFLGGNGGVGGLYGGGGGCRGFGGTVAAGAQGLIVITYVPIPGAYRMFFTFH